MGCKNSKTSGNGSTVSNNRNIHQHAPNTAPTSQPMGAPAPMQNVNSTFAK